MLARDRYNTAPLNFANIFLKEFEDGSLFYNQNTLDSCKMVLKQCQEKMNPYTLEYRMMKMSELRQVETSLESTLHNFYDVRKKYETISKLGG